VLVGVTGSAASLVSRAGPISPPCWWAWPEVRHAYQHGEKGLARETS